MGSLIHCPTEASSSFDWLTFLKDIAPIAIGLLAILISWLQIKSSERQRKEEHQREDINKRINDFYGPYIQLRKKSHILYLKFRRRYIEKDPEFSTLKYLLRGHKFKDNEKALLEEIITIGSKCESLIHEMAGYIDDDELKNNLIPKASTHYLLLRLAYQGHLTGDMENFIDSTFPKEIDSKLEKRIAELEDELVEINRFKWFRIRF